MKREFCPDVYTQDHYKFEFINKILLLPPKRDLRPYVNHEINEQLSLILEINKYLREIFSPKLQIYNRVTSTNSVEFISIQACFLFGIHLYKIIHNDDQPYLQIRELMLPKRYRERHYGTMIISKFEELAIKYKYAGTAIEMGNVIIAHIVIKKGYLPIGDPFGTDQSYYRTFAPYEVKT